MALQPRTVIARHQAYMGCRCGFRTSSPLCLHLEKLQMVSRGKPALSFNSQGRNLTPSAVLAVASATGEEMATAESSSMDGVLKGTGNNLPAQVEPTKQPPPPVESLSVTQVASPMVEDPTNPSASIMVESGTGNAPSIPDSTPLTGLNEPSVSASVDNGTVNGVSVAGLTPSEPNIKALEQSPYLGSSQPNAESPMNAALTATDGSREAANNAADSLSSDQFKSAKEAYEALLSGTGEPEQGDSPTEALSEASKSFADGLSEVKDALTNGLSNAQDSIQSSVDNALKTLKSTYDDINGTIVNSLRNISSPGGNSITIEQPSSVGTGTSQGTFLDIVTSPFQMGTPANNALKVVVTSTENVTGKLLAGAGGFIARGYTSTKDVLPEEVQMYLDVIEKKLTQVSGPIQSVLEQVYTIILGAEKAVGLDPENPIIPIIIVVSGSISLGLIYRQLQYGGYSGDLTPASAFELIKNESNIVLIDIRPEEVRESDGIPDLRRQARFKVASVEQFKVQGWLQKMLKNVGDAEAAITAAAIKSLKNVQRNTKVILLDSDGSQSKSIARALKKAGIKLSYRIDGGFKGWATDGLRVKQVGSETPLTILKEETEALLDEVKPTPSGIAAATLGAFAGLYALIEWEKTLQLLGLVCIVQVVYSRLNSYESADDAKNDLKLLLRPFAVATQGILWASGLVEPSKLQLATSPSTSAVQDRVIQAAAKHGPLPSEYESEQQPPAQPAEEVSISATGTDDSSVSQD